MTSAPAPPTPRWRVLCTVCVPGEVVLVGYADDQDQGGREVSAHQRQKHWPAGYGPFPVDPPAGVLDCTVGWAEPEWRAA